MAEMNNPFLNFDMQKMFKDAKMPGIDMEAILASQKKNFEALVSANQTVAEGYQAVAKRQVEITQASVQEAQAQLKALMESGASDDRVAKQTEIVKQAIEKAAQNMKELSDLIQKSQTEAFEILRRRVAESLDEIKDISKI